MKPPCTCAPASPPSWRQPRSPFSEQSRRRKTVDRGEYRSRVAPSDAAFDLIVRGGSVFDGSGSAGVPADIDVRGARIAAIAADLPGHGQRQVDPRRLAGTPGF